MMEYLNKIPREQVEYLFDERNIRLLEDTQYELRTEKIK